MRRLRPRAVGVLKREEEDSGEQRCCEELGSVSGERPAGSRSLGLGGAG